MKSLIKTILLLLALLLPAAAAAHDFEVDGIYYNINGNEATVTFRGTYTHSYSDEYTGDVTIPSTVTYGGITYAVTAIGERAFLFCDEVTSVTIPNSVTSIGKDAFYACAGLTELTIPKSVTSIGDGVCVSCVNLTTHRGKRQLSLRFPRQLQCHYRDGEQYIDSGLPELLHSQNRHRHRCICVRFMQRLDGHFHPEFCHFHRCICVRGLLRPDKHDHPQLGHRNRNHGVL